MLNTRIGLYSTFSSYFDPLWPRIGPVGIVSQSGAFGTYFLAIAAERGLGFSHCVATGNEADVDVAECVDWLADDPDTGVIMIYLEGCRDGARLRAALARAAANRKPVVAMKVGVSEQGVAAVASHTGSLVGSDAVFDAVFREYNVHRARSIDELVDVAYACSGARVSENAARRRGDDLGRRRHPDGGCGGRARPRIAAHAGRRAAEDPRDGAVRRARPIRSTPPRR